MANSKANIYPIQLQGAELCLNKYDAEIKQYSGFNKNNSPFVGGCLSNIFTKEVEKTSSSVFVDEEENVYTLVNDTDAAKIKLMKDDEVIKDFPNTSVCWHREKIIPAENCVRVFSENIQLLLDSNSHFYLKTNADVYDLGQFAINYDVESMVFKFASGIFINANNTNLFVFAMYSSIRQIICIINADTGALIDTKQLSVYNRIPTFDYPLSICYNSEHSQISYFYSYDIVGDPNPYARFYELNNDNTFGHEYGSYIFSNTWLGTTVIANCAVPDFKYWRFSGYPYNKGTLIKSSDYGDMATGKDLMISLSNPYYDGSGICPASYSKTSNNVVRLFEDEEIQSENVADGTITGMICSYDYQHYVAQTPTSDRKFLCVHYNSYENKFNFFSFSDFSFNGGTVKRGRYAMAEFIPLGNNFHLLFNNNQFSGIAGAQVLLSNWNSVEAETLCFKTGTYDGVTKESLCYKEGSTWYVLKNGEPEFKVLGNQIVTNIDVAENAYDFKRDKILSFAPAFNGVTPYGPGGTSGFFFDSSVTNNYICAAAINEYKLENNASIILNPISVYVSGGVVVFGFSPYTKHLIDFYDNGKTNDTNVKYRYTVRKEDSYTIKYRDNDLIGLNYPTDTNGNVMYSPDLFMDVVSVFGNNAYIKTGDKGYPLVIGNNLEFVFSYYLGNEVEGLEEIFVIQGQPYVIINGYIYAINFNNGVISNTQCVVSIENLQFCGQTPYMALFFSKTNRCLYSFTGANVLNQYKLIDKISTISGYYYNPATQSNILFTDIGIIILSVFGIFKVDKDGLKVFILNNGVCFIINDNETEKLFYLKYYLDEGDEDYTKENILLETSFYGMNNQTVTINDCLYMRIFSEEHEEGSLKVSATTISLSGRKTEETTFKFKASDWDAITHTIYLRYQPKTQRGLGVSFSIDSPFKIASLSVGSQADAILVDKVSKGAINAPQITSNNAEW